MLICGQKFYSPHINTDSMDFANPIIPMFVGLVSCCSTGQNRLKSLEFHDGSPNSVVLKKTFHKSFIKNCPSGGVCFYTFPYVRKFCAINLNFRTAEEQPQPSDYLINPKILKTKSDPQPLSGNPSKHAQFHTYSTLWG